MFPTIATLKAKATTNGAASAIINGELVIGYADLLALVARVSNHFDDRRLARGLRVFLNVKDPDLWLVTLLACLHYGLVPYVVGDPGGLRPGIEVDLVISSPLLLAEGLASDLVIDEAVLAGPRSDPRLCDFSDRGRDELLMIGGTSGTTGMRKLVVHRNARYRQIAFDDPENGLKMPRDAGRLLMTLGDTTIAGVRCVLMLLAEGNTLVRNDPDPRRALAQVNRHDVTHIATTPAPLAIWTGLMAAEGIRCPSVERIEVIGALLPKALVERTAAVFPGARLEVAYGSSEAGMISRGTIDPATFRVGYVGQVLPWVEIVSRGTFAAPAPLVISNQRDGYGEYYVDGGIVPHEQAEYAVPDFAYCEGDTLYLLGRQDEVLNLGGNKHAFATIEAAIRYDAAIADLGLLNTPADIATDGLVIAFVSEGAVDFAAIAGRIAAALKAPSVGANLVFFQVPAIPRNAMGKVDRQALLAEFRASLGAGR